MLVILGAVSVLTSSIAGRPTSEGRVTANIYLRAQKQREHIFNSSEQEVANIIRIFEKLTLVTEFSRNKFHLLGTTLQISFLISYFIRSIIDFSFVLNNVCVAGERE